MSRSGWEWMGAWFRITHIGRDLIIMNKLFTFVENQIDNLRSVMHLSMVKKHSTQYDMESNGNLAAQTWNLVPVHVKDLKALSTFKNQIKKWIQKDRPCHLCKVYVAQVCFL